MGCFLYFLGGFGMIRNLNQLSFRGFGRVPSGRNPDEEAFDRDRAEVWQLSVQTTVVCRARADTWLSAGTSGGVLGVSVDGRTWQEYYLDKTVCIREGIRFRLGAFLGPSEVCLYSLVPPERLGEQPAIHPSVERKVLVEGIYTFFYHEKEEGFLFSGEAHPISELTYVDGGSLHSVADGQELILRQGDLVLYGPGQWHMQYADIGVAPRFVTISFGVNPGAVEPLLNRKFAATQAVAGLVQSMLREREKEDELSMDMILTQLNLLLLLLLREVASPSGEKLRPGAAVHAENEIIRKAQQYITQHIRDKLTVPLVAQKVDVSPSYLTTLFHRNLQLSPGEYIRRIKLQESKQLIRENELNFTEIAAALQYSTVHHFSRQFKEKFGMTPSEYAKSVRG